MSRIPSKAMPHAYAPEGTDSHDIEKLIYQNEAPTLGERAGALVDRIKTSRAAQVAAGAAVAGAVAAAATAMVRSRRGEAKAQGAKG